MIASDRCNVSGRLPSTPLRLYSVRFDIIHCYNAFPVNVSHCSPSIVVEDMRGLKIGDVVVHNLFIACPTPQGAIFLTAQGRHTVAGATYTLENPPRRHLLGTPPCPRSWMNGQSWAYRSSMCADTR